MSLSPPDQADREQEDHVPPDSAPDSKPQVILADAGGWLSGPSLDADQLPEPQHGEASAMLLRDLGSLADQLAGLDHVAALRAQSGDEDAFTDSAEQLLQLHSKFAEKYRSLLLRRLTLRRPDRMST
jgi:hypothetical protein